MSLKCYISRFSTDAYIRMANGAMIRVCIMIRNISLYVCSLVSCPQLNMNGLVVFLALVAGACAQNNSVVDVLSTLRETVLIDLVQAAGLADTLKTGGKKSLSCFAFIINIGHAPWSRGYLTTYIPDKKKRTN